MAVRGRMINNRKDDLYAIVRDDAQKTLLDLHGGIVLTAAVDTGTYRAAWEVDTTALKLTNNTEYAEYANQASDYHVEGEIDRVTRG